MLDGDRLYLAAGETLAIPFKLRNLRHASGSMESSLPGTPQSGQSGSCGGMGPGSWHTVGAELLTLTDGRPVAVLQVRGRPSTPPATCMRRCAATLPCDWEHSRAKRVGPSAAWRLSDTRSFV